MLLPYVKIHELSEAYAPIRANIRNRILLLGETTRGPLSFRYIGGFSDFARTYGTDTARVSLAYQAAFAQGAREFAVVRILGKAKPAKVIVRFSGYTTSANRLFLNFRYVGEALNRTNRPLRARITPDGIPISDANGRIWFRVAEVNDEGYARIKYHFLPDGVNNEIDWDYGEPDHLDLLPLPIYPLPDVDPLGYLPLGHNNYFQPASAIDQNGVIINPNGQIVDTNLAYKIPPEGEVVLNVNTDAGSLIPTTLGVSLVFGGLEQVNSIPLAAGDTWSVKLSATTFEVDLYEGALPNQISTSIIEAIQDKDPIGNITRTEQDDGIVIPLTARLEGSIGNRFAFFIDAEHPDGEVLCETTFYAGESYVNIPLKYAQYIQKNASVEVVPLGGQYGVPHFSDPNDPSGPAPDIKVLPPSVRVVKVEVPMTGDLAIVWLDKAITAPFDSITLFRFMNPLGMTFTNNTWNQLTYLSGGEDGPRNAFRDLYDLNGVPLVRLLAQSPGEWGNSLRVDVYPLSNSSFRMTVRDLNKASYTYPIEDEVFNVSLSNTDPSGLLTDLTGSNHIRGLFLPKALNPQGFNVNLQYRSPMRLAPPDPNKTGNIDPSNPLAFGPEYLRNISLEDGYNGPPLVESDYTSAIDSISNEPVHFLLTPGVWKSDVIKQKLIAAAEASEELEGLRIAILNAPPNLSPEAAPSATLGYDSKRAVMVAGWSTYAGQPNAPRFGLSPDCIEAGKLSALPYWVSPAARSTSGPVSGISEVDTRIYSTNSQLNRFLSARLEVIALDPALGTFYVMSGTTLSSDPRWDRINKRRSYDVVRMDLFGSLQAYKSEPLTPLLLRQIAASIDSYMNVKVRNGHIQNYTQCVVTSPQPGYVEVQLSFQPIGAADYIDIYLIDQMSTVSLAA